MQTVGLVQTGPVVPYPLVGASPLAGSRVCEGVWWDDVLAGRGVGVVETYVCHPLLLATKILPGVPPYFPNYQSFLGP